jgi:BspA type Leucine rich repeat region (6 copies)
MNKRKITRKLLLLVLMLSTIAQAQFNVPVFYTTNNGTITITGYEGEGDGNPYGALIIPSTINGLPVTSIGNGAFENLYGVTSITIPTSVTSIGQYAFAYTGPTSVIIGNGVNSIGDDAFWDCGSLTSVYFKGNAPSLGSDVFYGQFNDNISIVPENATAYYISGTSGWSTTFGGLQTALWFLPNPLILNTVSSFGAQTNGFSFTVFWATNTSIAIEASTNLSVWQPIQTNALIGGTNYFNDLQWTNYPRRFYRIRSQ